MREKGGGGRTTCGWWWWSSVGWQSGSQGDRKRGEMGRAVGGSWGRGCGVGEAICKSMFDRKKRSYTYVLGDIFCPQASPFTWLIGGASKTPGYERRR